jgi:hypothetical protein
MSDPVCEEFVDRRDQGVLAKTWIRAFRIWCTRFRNAPAAWTIPLCDEIGQGVRQLVSKPISVLCNQCGRDPLDSAQFCESEAKATSHSNSTDHFKALVGEFSARHVRRCLLRVLGLLQRNRPIAASIEGSQDLHCEDRLAAMPKVPRLCSWRSHPDSHIHATRFQRTTCQKVGVHGVRHQLVQKNHSAT